MLVSGAVIAAVSADARAGAAGQKQMLAGEIPPAFLRVVPVDR